MFMVTYDRTGLVHDSSNADCGEVILADSFMRNGRDRPRRPVSQLQVMVYHLPLCNICFAGRIHQVMTSQRLG